MNTTAVKINRSLEKTQAGLKRKAKAKAEARDGANKAAFGWTPEMDSAPGIILGSAGLAAQVLGVDAALVESTPSRFSKEQRKTIRSVLVRRAQVEVERDHELNAIALAEVLAEEAKTKGRPSEYTPEMGDLICAWVRNGHSLSKFCQMYGLANETVHRWLRSNSSFHAAYCTAHDDRTDTLADQMLDMLDDAEGASLEEIALLKLKVDTRKWIASKLRPQKWGDKTLIEHSGGGVSINIGIPRLQVVEEAKMAAPPRLSPEVFTAVESVGEETAVGDGWDAVGDAGEAQL